MDDWSREEHLAWSKRRALEYLDRGDLGNALASFGSDMRQHSETDMPAVSMLGMEGIRCCIEEDAPGLRRLIEGFQ